MPDHAPPPTRARYVVLGFSVSMAVLLYLDRYAFSNLTQQLVDEFHREKSDVGSAIAAFFWGYALTMLPAGWLADRWGGRISLTLFAAVWSAAMVGLACAHDLNTIIAFRVLLGVGQAGAFATTAGFLKLWFPTTQRGFANGSVSMGGRAGVLLTFLFTPQLMVLFAYLSGESTLGWRATFVTYAGLGWLWCAAFYYWFRNTPEEFALSKERDRSRIQSPHPSPLPEGEGADAPNIPKARVDAEKKKFPWRALLGSPNVWLLCMNNFCINVGWIFLVTWLPNHLEGSPYNLSTREAGLFTAATALAGMAGCLCGGWITDRFVARFGLIWGRRIPALLASGGPALACLGCLATDNLVLTLALLGTVYFLSDMWLGAGWSIYQDIGGAHVGSVLAVANMCGNIGAAVFSKAIGYFANEHQWWAVFAISAGSFMVAFAGWLLVNPRVPLEGANHAN